MKSIWVKDRIRSIFSQLAVFWVKVKKREKNQLGLHISIIKTISKDFEVLSHWGVLVSVFHLHCAMRKQSRRT